MTPRRIAAGFLLLVIAGCATARPPQQPTAALYRDLERLVTIADTTGWGVDRIELEDLLGASLDSVCRVERSYRQQLLAWLDQEIARNGGPVEAAWRARGKQLSEVEQLLTLTRIRLLLAYGDEHADADCPFYLEPEASFAGRQISDDRWTLSGGGGAKLMGIVQGDVADMSVGGAARALLGRTFGSHALYSGIEVGASANFPKDEMGMRSNLVVGVDVVVPLVYRYTLVNSYVELEGGYLMIGTEKDPLAVDSGFHIGAAIGGRATRTRFFFPGAALGISYERAFPDGDDPLNVLKIGLRVALDIDL